MDAVNNAVKMFNELSLEMYYGFNFKAVLFRLENSDKQADRQVVQAIQELVDICKVARGA